jgi:TonB-dependent SusC/RagA subfamily outer membrane receptor
LKDASATAIYGIRAANGVVIITTKKGLKNRTQVSLDMYVSSQTTPKQYDLLNAQDFAALSNEVEAADSTHTYHGLPIWHTPDALHTVDWQDAIYRTGVTQIIQLVSVEEVIKFKLPCRLAITTKKVLYWVRTSKDIA